MYMRISLMIVSGWLLAVGVAQARELPQFTQLAAQNSAAVVNISTRQQATQRRSPPQFNIPDMPEGGPWEDFLRRFFGEENDIEAPPGRSLGSGFVIDPDGYILTNNHVVEKADEILVRFSDRRELIAELVGTDSRSDIALIKVDAEDLPAVKLGSSVDLLVGEWVMAIGSPFGFDHSVSVGVISALGRSLPQENYVPFIQTDVAINPGNSGGPLFNLDGEVIGINSQIYSRTGGFMGVSFAIPITVAMDAVEQLKESGFVARGWLGVLIQDVTRELAESFGMKKPMGALIVQVFDDSPASTGGIEVGDIIIEFNGKSIDYSSSLPPVVGLTPIDSDAKVKVIRDGKIRTLTIQIGTLPTEDTLSRASTGSQRGNNKRLALSVIELTAEQREEFDVAEGGVLVTEVNDGPAAAAGIEAGDIILKLNGQDITDTIQFQKLVKDLPDRRSVPVLIKRAGGPRFLALKLTE